MELNEIHTEHEHATTSLKVLLLVFAIVLVGALAYLVWAQNTAPDTTDNSATTVKKTATATTGETADWKTYTNETYGFSIKYPAQIKDTEWKIIPVSGTTETHFGPVVTGSALEGYDGVWGISVITGKSADQVMAEFGDQFGDRKQSKKNIVISGKTATLVTITTASMPDWVSKNVVLSYGSTVFSIGNGALDNEVYSPYFEDFYSSFKITK